MSLFLPRVELGLGYQRNLMTRDKGECMQMKSVCQILLRQSWGTVSTAADLSPQSSGHHSRSLYHTRLYAHVMCTVSVYFTASYGLTEVWRTSHFDDTFSWCSLYTFPSYLEMYVPIKRLLKVDEELVRRFPMAIIVDGLWRAIVAVGTTTY